MFRASLCPFSGEQDVCYCMRCTASVLLDVVGSGCGALCCGVRALWRLLFDSAALWDASTVKVIVRQCCVVGCEHCEGYCSTVLRCGVRALWRLLFDSAALWDVSTVKVIVRQCCVVGCEHCEGYCSTVNFTVLAPHNVAPHNRYQPHLAEPAQYINLELIEKETYWTF